MNTEQPANWYFSFGHGQEHFGKYVKIHGTSKYCRDEMHRRFGAKWSMQYTEEEMLPKIERWDWTEVQ